MALVELYCRKLSIFSAFLALVLKSSYAQGDKRQDGDIQKQMNTFCQACQQLAQTHTGAYILEYGEEALISRAWLTMHFSRSILSANE